MRLSEKNVLIATGILFVIVLGILNNGNEKSDKQIEDRASIKLASSSYNMKDGRLTLEFENTAKEFELSRITIMDENRNSFRGKSKREKSYIIFDTYIPELNGGDILNIVIEDNSTNEIKIEYKVSENDIIST
ncbi:hypothetical protein [Sporosarcina sp. JAI121]|uniref:hypothetical protein n=1 Tax=Sporosarcina sp. JAI121 TaxID=2723064 RepID=UPI0015CDDA09|nr:hypothetical protein [Sporosarcina sp. JAI121]NYF24857.1 hypothetical protein [Sporosarcina sp. JAI121]